MLREQGHERGEVRAGILGKRVMRPGGSCRTREEQHLDCPSLHRNEAELVDDSTEGSTLAIGVMSMSFRSTRDLGVNFCKVVVRSNNSWARPSPRQVCFPENNRGQILLEHYVSEPSQKEYRWVIEEMYSGRQDGWIG